MRPMFKGFRKQKQAIRQAVQPFETLEERTLLSSYFVSTSGSDGGAGTIDSPWRTVQYAVNTAKSGDVVNLRAGTYAGNIKINTGGLTVQGYNGEKAVIASSNTDANIAATVKIGYDAHGTTLRNLEVSGGYYYSVMTDSTWGWGDTYYGVRNVTLDNVKAHDSGRDVIKVTPGASNFTITNSEIYNSGKRDASNAEGIDAVNVTNFVMRDSWIHNTATDGIYVKGGSVGTLIERNRVTDTGWGGILLGQDTDADFFDTNTNPTMYESIDGVVRNNLIVNTGSAGIGIWAALRPKVYNNTLVNVAKTMQAAVMITGVDHYPPPGYDTAVPRSSTDVTFINNIVSTSSSRPTMLIRDGALTGSFTTGNNLYYRAGGSAQFWDERNGLYGTLANWKSSFGDTGSLETNPMLDAAHHLAAGSPAINAGRALAAVTDDFDKQARPAGGAYDIGADESGSTTTTPAAAAVLQYSLSGYTVSEGVGTATLTVVRSGDTSIAVSVAYATGNNTALAGSDYTATSGILSFAAGETTKTFGVTIINDTTVEGSESLYVSLANPTNGATLGANSIVPLAITNDDAAALPAPSLQYSTSAYSVGENVGTATVTVTRTGDTSTAVSVTYATGNNTALAGSDYTATSGILNFAAGETSKTFGVTIINDTAVEANESLYVSLANPTGGAVLGTTSLATLTIVSDDVATPTTPTTPATGTGDGLKGEYFNNKDFTGLKMTRTDATVNYNWAKGAPATSMAADTYSVRWTGQVLAAKTETYTFYTTSDDGVRLWVNNQLVVNNWYDQSATEATGKIALTAGQKYNIKLEYYENSGDASAKLAWSSATTAKQIIPQSQLFSGTSTTPAPAPTPSNGLKAEYYDNMDFTNLKLTRTDAAVNFNWAAGSPDSSMGVDTYSVRWTGKIMPKYSETYTFYTTSDDGMRLWINGQQVITNWYDQSATEATGRITLVAGQKYDIKLEYYENGGDASAKLAWSSASQTKEIVPTSQLFLA